MFFLAKKKTCSLMHVYMSCPRNDQDEVYRFPFQNDSC